MELVEEVVVMGSDRQHAAAARAVAAVQGFAVVRAVTAVNVPGLALD